MFKKFHSEFNLEERLTKVSFLRFLLSRYNIVMHRDHLMLKEEDMHKPLSHYFINSSHNTYLRGYYFPLTVTFRKSQVWLMKLVMSAS